MTEHGTNEPSVKKLSAQPAGATSANDHEGCISCSAEIDHYLGCPDDPNPDYEAEAEAEAELQTRRALRLADYLEALIPHVVPCVCDACLTLRESVMFMREIVPASYRRTNEPRPLEVEPSTAGATGGGDLGEN